MTNSGGAQGGQQQRAAEGGRSEVGGALIKQVWKVRDSLRLTQTEPPMPQAAGCRVSGRRSWTRPYAGEQCGHGCVTEVPVLEVRAEAVGEDLGRREANGGAFSRERQRIHTAKRQCLCHKGGALAVKAVSWPRRRWNTQGEGGAAKGSGYTRQRQCLSCERQQKQTAAPVS